MNAGIDSPAPSSRLAGGGPEQEAARVGGRVSWVDAAKGVGIFLVVVGHTLRGVVGGGLTTWTPPARAVDDWIYSFHMPLFFFLSGLFLARSAAKPFGVFAGDKLRTIAYPYLVWSTLTVIIKVGLGRLANNPRGFSDLARIARDPIEQFWFLYVLFFLVMAAGVLLKAGAGPLGLVALAMVAYPGVVPVSTGGWAPLIEARFFAIYLAAGIVFGAGRGATAAAKARGPWLIALAVAGLLAPTLAVAWGVTGREWLRPFLASGGIAGVVAASVLADRGRFAGAIAVLGRYSLEIFVAHTIASAALRIVLQKFLKIHDPATHLTLGTIAGLLGPLALAVACRRVGFPHAFTLPKRAGIRPQPSAPA